MHNQFQGANLIKIIHIIVAALLPLSAATSIAEDFPFASGKINTDIKPTDVIRWDGSDARELEGGMVSVGLRLTTKDDFTLYTKKVKIMGPEGWTIDKIVQPPTRTVIDPIGGATVEVYYGGDFQVTFKAPSKWTSTSFPVRIKYVGCTQVICLFPYTQSVDVPFFGRDRLSAGPASSTTKDDVPLKTNSPDDDESFEEEWSNKLSKGGVPYSLLLLIVFIGGIISNLTPCVYPMIPITLRLLSSQGGSPYKNASIYASGIVVTYTSLGVGAAMSGGMFGAMLASVTFNLVFAAIMTSLGITMLGFGDFSKLQMIGNKLGAGKASFKNTFLMGAGAGLVAAPCTGPILAALLAYTAKNQASVLSSSFLLFFYSVGFALPYVLLGGAAAKVSQRKVSPKVQVGVKLVFASVMFALGIYYLRIPFYSTFTKLADFWSITAVYAGGIGIVLALIWVSAPKLQNNKFSMLLPSLVLGVGIFAFSQWATQSDHNSTGESGVKLTWTHTESEAIAAASQTNKPILIDFWAEWCEACKKMDKTTFMDPEVRSKLDSEWTLLKLDLTEETEQNDAIQEKYKLAGLPSLVLLKPDGTLEGAVTLGGFTSAKKLLLNLDQFSKAE